MARESRLLCEFLAVMNLRLQQCSMHHPQSLDTRSGAAMKPPGIDSSTSLLIVVFTVISYLFQCTEALTGSSSAAATSRAAFFLEAAAPSPGLGETVSRSAPLFFRNLTTSSVQKLA